MATSQRVIEGVQAMPVSSSRDEKRRAGVAEGREWVVRGVLRYTNSLLVFFLLLSMISNAWLVYAWRANARELAAEVRKQWIVISPDKDGRPVARPASDFQTGPTDLQIESLAWEEASLIATAGSADVDQKFADALKYATQRFRNEFDDTLGAEREEIKRLRIYHELEDGEVRRATPEDFSQMPVRPDLTRFDQIVTGRLSTYGIDNKERLLVRHVAFHVRLVPLPEPTRENPFGLMVDRVIPVKLPAKVEEVRNDAQGK